jgi:hypothetical protein
MVSRRLAAIVAAGFPYQPVYFATRLEAVQHMAPPKMVAHSSKLAKLKAWFAAAA